MMKGLLPTKKWQNTALFLCFQLRQKLIYLVSVSSSSADFTSCYSYHTLKFHKTKKKLQFHKRHTPWRCDKQRCENVVEQSTVKLLPQTFHLCLKELCQILKMGVQCFSLEHFVPWFLPWKLWLSSSLKL